MSPPLSTVAHDASKQLPQTQASNTAIEASKSGAKQGDPRYPNQVPSTIPNTTYVPPTPDDFYSLPEILANNDPAIKECDAYVQDILTTEAKLDNNALQLAIQRECFTRLKCIQVDADHAKRLFRTLHERYQSAKNDTAERNQYYALVKAISAVIRNGILTFANVKGTSAQDPKDQTRELVIVYEFLKAHLKGPLLHHAQVFGNGLNPRHPSRFQRDCHERDYVAFELASRIVGGVPRHPKCAFTGETNAQAAHIIPANSGFLRVLTGTNDKGEAVYGLALPGIMVEYKAAVNQDPDSPIIVPSLLLWSVHHYMCLLNHKYYPYTTKGHATRDSLVQPSKPTTYNMERLQFVDGMHVWIWVQKLCVSIRQSVANVRKRPYTEFLEW
ncbi:MAG: hypothetical protein Q9165_000455 [Trypethelium subeluteriae]